MSSSRSLIVTVLSIALASVACARQQPNYCDIAPDHNCMELGADARISDTGVGCSIDKGVNSSSCTGKTPICGIDSVCHACTMHAQCGSNVCLPDGSCASEANVAYVAADGSGNDCSQAAPCRTLQDALLVLTQPNRIYVKISTGFIKVGRTTIDQNVTILADTGANLLLEGNGPILDISGQATVDIYNLAITGNANTNNDGIDLSLSGGSLNLHHVAINSNGNRGITATHSNLTIEGSSISGNRVDGINTMDGTLSITRSSIFYNHNGIVSHGTNFVIENNFIYGNGNSDDTSTIGVKLSSIVPTMSSFRFNTIVYNIASGSNVASISCDQPGFKASHNLIFGNTGNSQTPSFPTAGGTCLYDDSFATAIINNLSMMSFLKADSAPYDYHLRVDSSVRNAVQNDGECTGLDFDGDPRPIHGPCALGADQPSH